MRARNFALYAAGSAALLIALAVSAATYQATAALMELRISIRNQDAGLTKLLTSATVGIEQLEAVSVQEIARNGRSTDALVRRLDSLAVDLHRKADQSYVIANKTNASTAAAATASYRLIRELELEVFGEEAQRANYKPGQPLIQAARDTIQASTQAIRSTDRAIQDNGQQIHADLSLLAGAIESGTGTLDILRQPVERVGTNLERTSASLADGTQELAETAKSIRIATDPLRKVEGRLRAWLRAIAPYLFALFR